MRVSWSSQLSSAFCIYLKRYGPTDSFCSARVDRVEFNFYPVLKDLKRTNLCEYKFSYDPRIYKGRKQYPREVLEEEEGGVEYQQEHGQQAG